MRGGAFIFRVIDSCETQTQLFSAEEWAFRLVQREFPKPTPERKLILTAIISRLESKSRTIDQTLCFRGRKLLPWT